MNTIKTSLAAGLAALLLSAAPATYATADSPVSAAQIESARTPAEHEAVAKLFEDEAAHLTQKSEMHGDMAKTFGAPGLKPTQAAIARHCVALEREYRAAAKDNLALAALHHRMAREASK